MSELHKRVYFTIIGLAIISMVSLMTFFMSIYLDIMLCEKLCEIAEMRIIGLVEYCSKRNITIRISLNEIVNRPMELIVVNSNTLLIAIPTKYFHVKVTKCVKFDNINFNYTGMLPFSFYFIFLRINNTSFVMVREA